MSLGAKAGGPEGPGDACETMNEHARTESGSDAGGQRSDGEHQNTKLMLITLMMLHTAARIHSKLPQTFIPRSPPSSRWRLWPTSTSARRGEYAVAWRGDSVRISSMGPW